MRVSISESKTPLSWNQAYKLITSHTREIVSATICADPVTSVCVMTYNHRLYIGQALDSILEQVVDFPFEILVGDDNSCDGTTDIVLDYQRRYPERIRVLLADENLGRYTGNGRLNLIRLLRSCRGPYVAFLEGDDYWIGTEKLAWGVSFLMANPQFNIAFNNLMIEYPDGHHKRYYILEECSTPQLPMPQIFTDFNDLLHGAFIHVSTVIARYQPFDKRQLELFVKLNFGDFLLMLVLAGNRQLYFQDVLRSCYRYHGKGIYSSFNKKITWEKYLEDKKMISMFYSDICPEVAEKNLKGILERPWARDKGDKADGQSFDQGWRGTIRRNVYAYSRALISRLGAILDAVEMMCTDEIEGHVVAFCDDAGGEMMAAALGLIRRGERERTLILIPAGCQARLQRGPIATAVHDPIAIRLAVLSTGYPEHHVRVQSAETKMPPNVPRSIGLLLLPEAADGIPEKWLNFVLARLVSGAIVLCGGRVWRREPQEMIGAFLRRLDSKVNRRDEVPATVQPHGRQVGSGKSSIWE